jgi:protoheme IX farnesyltransferase
MLSYGSALLPVSLMPALLRMSGRIYMAGALILGIAFLYFIWRLARTKLPTTSDESRRLARHLLQASVIYLPLLFALMMLNVVRS